MTRYRLPDALGGGEYEPLTDVFCERNHVGHDRRRTVYTGPWIEVEP